MLLVKQSTLTCCLAMTEKTNTSFKDSKKSPRPFQKKIEIELFFKKMLSDNKKIFSDVFFRKAAGPPQKKSYNAL